MTMDNAVVNHCAKEPDDIGLRCVRCGYNLTGLTENRCPECGLSLDPDRIQAHQDFIRKRFIARFCFAAVALLSAYLIVASAQAAENWIRWHESPPLFRRCGAVNASIESAVYLTPWLRAASGCVIATIGIAAGHLRVGLGLLAVIPILCAILLRVSAGGY